MNVHPLRRSLPSAEPAQAVDDRLARIEIFKDFAAVEPYWRTLEGSGLSTPYQRYDFLKLWQHHVGGPAGVTPFIVVGLNARGAPLFVWPLGRRWLGRLRIAE